MRIDHENPAVRVRRAPRGLPAVDDFEVADVGVVPPRDGEVLFRGLYLAIDPSARRRLPAPAHAPDHGPLGDRASVGDVVVAGVSPATCGLDGAVVGEVVESRDPGFAVGDLVRGGNAWQMFHTVPGRLLDLLEPGTSLSSELGILGRPGLVGHVGMRLIGRVRAGETVVVSAAGGGVGTVAGQIARLAGARVVGIASGEKAIHVVSDLGYDACVDRATEEVGAALDRLCPDGVDVYFDNVGGAVSRAVFDRMRSFGRVVVCGMAAEYNAPEDDTGPPWRPVLRKRLRIEGFVVQDHYADYPDYRRWMVEQLDAGLVRHREDLLIGIEHAPTALANVLSGRSRGRQLVQL
ncbi:MAG: NADP-dependent oxidoreductase [Nocardioides sp.]|nr:NADP-dependent oxidoreductase [Nocardioides sp.]